MTQGVEPERVRFLNDRPVRQGRYVLYWMQASQRASGNPALEHAVALGNDLGLPVAVAFGLTPSYPEANLRHYAFMLAGLKETALELADRGIRFVLRFGDPPEVALELAREAAALVTDRSYLRHGRAWRADVASRAPCPVVEVEGDAVVPVELAYGRQAWSAAVLRRRIRPLLPRFLHPLPEQEPRRSSLGLDLPGEDPEKVEPLLDRLPVVRPVPPLPLPAGTAAARQRLDRFVADGLRFYADRRNHPSGPVTSGLSPYLHFGQISPVEVALRVQGVGGPGADAFLEELVVRRELALNFVLYNSSYDAFHGLPLWARRTLRRHSADPRPALYSPKALEQGETDDPIWNAAQTQLRREGTIHAYLRMYWGKMFLLWTTTPEEAFRLALALNNKYALDGRDPSSYGGVGWCFGLHDRPFPERPIWGNVRPMTRRGLEGKFDLRPYLARVRALEEE
ncbi:MAG: deoxyribodipyrimidine photo-lyase [Candidatus Acetothermia bacterium]|jgi:deoxyribodipyrimidine photo-lyase|nr:deoxyribodipyrimidine photo-lyase [Candidatus Acetothermia bacterium]